MRLQQWHQSHHGTSAPMHPSANNDVPSVGVDSAVISCFHHWRYLVAAQRSGCAKQVRCSRNEKTAREG